MPQDPCRPPRPQHWLASVDAWDGLPAALCGARRPAGCTAVRARAASGPADATLGLEEAAPVASHPGWPYPTAIQAARRAGWRLHAAECACCSSWPRPVGLHRRRAVCKLQAAQAPDRRRGLSASRAAPGIVGRLVPGESPFLVPGVSRPGGGLPPGLEPERRAGQAEPGTSQPDGACGSAQSARRSPDLELGDGSLRRARHRWGRLWHVVTQRCSCAEPPHACVRPPPLRHGGRRAAGCTAVCGGVRAPAGPADATLAHVQNSTTGLAPWLAPLPSRLRGVRRVGHAMPCWTQAVPAGPRTEGLQRRRGVCQLQAAQAPDRPSASARAGPLPAAAASLAFPEAGN